MPRTTVVDPSQATGKAKDLLDQVKSHFGVVPNVAKMMAAAPAVLESYMNFAGALGSGVLDPQLRERIALAVAEFNNCEYCLSSHVMLGKKAGLSEAEITAARQATSADPKAETALQFVHKVLERRAEIADEDVDRLHQVGFSDEEVVEIVGHTIINIFTNYFNKIVDTEVDVPRIKPRARAASLV